MDEHNTDHEGKGSNLSMDGALIPTPVKSSAKSPASSAALDDSALSEDERADYAADVLQSILDHMDFDTDVEVREENDTQIILDIDGPDAGRAIGKRGQTLDALQFMVNKMVNRFPEGRRYILVDSGDYRDRHEDGLMSMAKREAKRALKSQRVVHLRPMSARDRRVIHLSLAKFDGVRTCSDGEGTRRHIQIIPADLNARSAHDHDDYAEGYEDDGPLDALHDDAYESDDMN